MESIPAELLFDIYLRLDRDDIDNLSLVSKYIRECKPAFQYLHRIKFNDCLKEISLMKYKIGSANFSCYDVAVGYCIIYDITHKYYVNSVKQEFPYSVRQFNNSHVFYVYNSEICINKTYDHEPRIEASDCLTVIFDPAESKIFTTATSTESKQYGEMLRNENCNKNMHLRQFWYNVKKSYDYIKSDDCVKSDD